MIVDQNGLNDFLSTVVFKKSSVHFVESENANWSVLLHYEEDDGELQPTNKDSIALQPKEQDLTPLQQEVFGILKQ
ncbi:MAG: hypothetical protein PSV16_00785 [Flavobacterium sp.]|nr:hypothetical protein [Flavobacterium sp.]